MNKFFLFFCFLTLLSANIQAQCPMSIQDDSGDGSSYVFILSDVSECSAYIINDEITISGGTTTGNYGITNCAEDFGTTTVLLSFNAGTAVTLSSDAPVSFSIGGTTCSYDDAGNFFVVPVELLFFKGYHKDGVNILNWQTASELNNEGFNIERSEDAKSWKTLGFVKGNGTTVQAQDYTFLDEQPAVGVSYYRLQQLDFDGQYEYSDIISLNNTSKSTKKELIVYPNPTSGTFQVQLPESNATVQLYNGQGSLVKEVIANSINFQLHMADLPTGAYLLKVQTGKQVWTQRVVVE